MPSDIQFALTSLAALFFVVDPFAAVPLLLSMTEGDSRAQRARTARKAALALGIVLTVFGAIGSYVLRLFGVGVPAFRIAGGALLFIMALEMLKAQVSATRTSDEEVAEGLEKPEIGTVPLGVPILGGPGAMSTITVLVHTAQTPLRIGLVFGCVLVTALSTYWILLAAEPVRRLLGTTGLHVLTRVMGLILAAVAVQFIVTGLTEAFPLLSLRESFAPQR